MKSKELEYRINLLQDRHAKLHKVVEALEGEKAPENSIKKVKIEKLKVKDEISQLERKVNAH